MISDSPEARKKIAAGLRGAAAHFRRSILPLYTVDDRGYPAPLGTCVLLMVGSTPFMISAAHVLEVAPKQIIYIGGELLTAMTGHLTHTKATQGRDHDRIDISACKLAPRTVEYLGRVRFLAVSDIDVNHVLDYARPKPYLVVGFPVSKQPRLRDAVQDAYPMLIGTRLAPLSAFESEKLDPQHSLLFEFDIENVESEHGFGRAPSPYGISGGAVLDTSEFYSRNAVPKLVGIIVEHAGPQRQCLLATRMETVLGMLVRRYPELGADLR